MKLTAYVSPRIIFIAGILFFTIQPVPANEIKSKSTIAAVTVYNDQALITRQAKETVPAGIHTVVITNLPWEMMDQSLKVSGISQNEVKISDIKIDQIFLDTIPESRTAELYQRLNLLRNEKNTLERNTMLYKSQYDAVDAMKENYTKSLSLQNPGQKASVEEWDKLLQFVEKKKFDYTEKMESIRREIDGKLAKIKAIEDEIRSIGAAAKKEQKEVSVVLNAAAAGMVTLEISYRTPNASWIPAYEIRAQAAEKSLQVSYSGNVRQSTGEDWNNVDLTLS
ncbi:MAG: mucoidy inhibitor MuiA family protein, partial [Bacteroidota bacterium]